MNFMKKRIIEGMNKLGITQTSLANEARVAQSTINRLLNTPIKSRIDTLLNVAHAIKLPIEYLITEDETKASLYLKINSMSKEEIEALNTHIEKERFLREHYDSPAYAAKTGNLYLKKKAS